MQKTASFDDFVRFLTKKNPAIKCSSCGGVEWNIFLNEDEHITEIVLPALNVVGGRTAYCATCKSCGLINMHLSTIVDSWIEQNPVEQPPEEASPEAEGK